jgi:hypothetical protein
MALIVPTAYIWPPHGTSRRTFWFGVLLSNHGVFVEGTVPTLGVAAAAAELNPKSTAHAATPAKKKIDFSLISPPQLIPSTTPALQKRCAKPSPEDTLCECRGNVAFFGKDCDARCVYRGPTSAGFGQRSSPASPGVSAMA